MGSAHAQQLSIKLDHAVAVATAGLGHRVLLLLVSLQAMDAVWGEGDQVQVIHPAAACIAGRSMVSQHLQHVQSLILGMAFRLAVVSASCYADAAEC